MYLYMQHVYRSYRSHIHIYIHTINTHTHIAKGHQRPHPSDAVPGQDVDRVGQRLSGHGKAARFAL